MTFTQEISKKKELNLAFKSVIKINNIYFIDFSGYVVYGFIPKSLYIFESNEPYNATYVFKGKWEDAFKLSKCDIIIR